MKKREKEKGEKQGGRTGQTGREEEGEREMGPSAVNGCGF